MCSSDLDAEQEQHHAGQGQPDFRQRREDVGHRGHAQFPCSGAACAAAVLVSAAPWAAAVAAIGVLIACVGYLFDSRQRSLQRAFDELNKSLTGPDAKVVTAGPCLRQMAGGDPPVLVAEVTSGGVLQVRGAVVENGSRTGKLGDCERKNRELQLHVSSCERTMSYSTIVANTAKSVLYPRCAL